MVAGRRGSDPALRPPRARGSRHTARQRQNMTHYTGYFTAGLEAHLEHAWHRFRTYTCCGYIILLHAVKLKARVKVKVAALRRQIRKVILGIHCVVGRSVFLRRQLHAALFPVCLFAEVSVQRKI